LALGVPFAQKEMLMSVARLFLFARFAMGPFLLLVGASSIAQTAVTTPTPACSNLLHKTFNRLQDDAPQDLCQYAGRVLLIVNTASYCGFTSQYEGLEKLHADRKEKGLVVLGFPSNDFGQQEPGSSKQIADFCANTYGVKFPMFEKSVVSGSGANQLYRDLAQATGKTPQWNFHKYLIGRDGKVISSYASNVTPQDKKLLTDIDRALSAN
jgi:glutathione peroxidase